MNKRRSLNNYQTLEIADMEQSQIEQVMLLALESKLSFWSRDDYKKEIDGRSGGSFIKTARIHRETIGFIAARTTFITNLTDGEIEIEIYNIAVKKKFRRKGIGQLLLDSLLKSALDYRRTAAVWLEVRQTNETAVNFYRANNFTVAGQRKNYYRAPTEDALVMKLEIGGAKHADKV